jgi:hypothetical protein
MSGLYAALAAAALSAVGTGVNSYAQNQNARKQDDQTAASIRNQAALNAQAEQKVGDLNAQIARSSPKSAQDQQTAAYVKALQQANATQSTVNPSVKGASKRYGQAVDASRTDVNNYARQTASNLAATAAPQLQRIGEGNAIANTASDLGIINDASGSEQGILKTKLAGDQADPWLGALSGLLQGAGSGLSTYGGYKRGGSTGSSNPYLGAGGGVGGGP